MFNKNCAVVGRHKMPYLEAVQRDREIVRMYIEKLQAANYYYAVIIFHLIKN